jgi:putative hydrolase of the HAD superfamily
MKPYKSAFFDLDHTLWDYERNSREALTDLYQHYELSDNFRLEDFLATFKRINFQLWHHHDLGKISREEIRYGRFDSIFRALGYENTELSLKFSEDYIALCPRKGHVFPHTHEQLGRLQDKYPLFIITNGFHDVQLQKLEHSGLGQYFKDMITSEVAGHKKPSPAIFHYTLQRAGIQAQEALMIGDNLLTDVQGAKNAQIDPVFFNPEEVAHGESLLHEINCLSLLSNIL